MATDLARFAVGGAAARPDSFNLDAEFATALQRMFAEAPPEIQAQLRIGSGFRSPETQQRLFADAVKKYGSEAAARKWVAPPGRSQHNHGRAVDLSYLDDAARSWAHANAANYGLAFPMAHEPWHIEPVGVRGKAAVPPHDVANDPVETFAPDARQDMPPQRFGDLVAPRAAPLFGDAISNFVDRKRAQAEQQAADHQRRMLLLADLFA